MPEVDGLAVLAEVRRRRPDVPVVLMSARLTVAVAVQAMREGAFDVLPKPFTAADVRAVADRALAGRPPDGQGYDERVARARAAVADRLLGAAAEHARGALALDPTRPEAFNVLGVVLQIRGQAADARRYYGAAAALRPGYGPALRNLENLAAGGRASAGRFDLGSGPGSRP